MLDAAPFQHGFQSVPLLRVDRQPVLQLSRSRAQRRLGNRRRDRGAECCLAAPAGTVRPCSAASATMGYRLKPRLHGLPWMRSLGLHDFAVRTCSPTKICWTYPPHEIRVRPAITFSSACRRSTLAPTHTSSAAVAVVVWDDSQRHEADAADGTAACCCTACCIRSRTVRGHGEYAARRCRQPAPPMCRLLIERTAADALLSGLPAWRCSVGCVRLRAPCPGVPGLWQSVRPRVLETRACQPMTGAAARLPVAVTR